MRQKNGKNKISIDQSAKRTKLIDSYGTRHDTPSPVKKEKKRRSLISVSVVCGKKSLEVFYFNVESRVLSTSAQKISLSQSRQTAASRIIFNLHLFKKRLRNKERFFSKKGVKHFLNKKVAKGLLRTCQRIYVSFSTRMYVSDLMLPTPDGWLTRPRARLGKEEKEEKEEEENNNYARKGDLNTAGARGGVLSTAAVSTGDLNFYVFGEKKLFFSVSSAGQKRNCPSITWSP